MGSPKEFIIINGVTTVHYVGVFQKDYALCGQDLAGDNLKDCEYDSGVVTDEDVNCKDCLAIVNYCHSLTHTCSKNERAFLDETREKGELFSRTALPYIDIGNYSTLHQSDFTKCNLQELMEESCG